MSYNNLINEIKYLIGLKTIETKKTLFEIKKMKENFNQKLYEKDFFFQIDDKLVYSRLEGSPNFCPSYIYIFPRTKK
jgi:hypothetical protein